MNRRQIFNALTLVGAGLLVSSLGSAAPPADKGAAAKDSGVPAHLSGLRLAEPITSGDVAKVGKSLLGAQGTVQLVVQLNAAPVTQATKGARASALETVRSQQASFMGSVSSAGGRSLGSVSRALNAVFVEMDASGIRSLAMDPRVKSIRAVRNYSVHLSETVPYIGAAAAQVDASDGSGVSVAVFDSGIDYLHANLGGSGDPTEYANNDPTLIEEDTFPTAKVVAGTDFVGSEWPDGELIPDPDPLDDGPEAGHGTHVADIIGGANGVAPGVDLYAVKVCSSVSPACSGVALLQGMDYALDPDGDPTTDDQVDIINMSLGANYGQAFDDDLSTAVDNASLLGVLTVASAGNASDKPYIVGTPSAAPSALSVAQTQVPSAALQLINAAGNDIPAVFQPWSVPVAGTVGGDIQYGDTDGDNLNGCSAFDGDLSGKVVLVDRGACNFTLKVKNIGDAGGSVGIIGLVAPGDPFSGGDGGDPVAIPGFMINQADSNFLKSQVGNVATVDPGNTLPLIGQMVGSSSRGPSVQFNSLIKPEIGAPGASVSAIAGTGIETGAFGGTSGAAPMVSGAAAIVLGSMGDLSPNELRAMLVNSAETDIDNDPFAGLAPITRIGGGEVRVDRAAAAGVAAWDQESGAPALSFGFLDATTTTGLGKTVVVRNYSDEDVTYGISPTFRYAADDSGAVVATTSVTSIDVPANGEASFNVNLEINPELLSDWYGNSGSLGADPLWLTDLEYDGYVQLDDAAGDTRDIHIPWHILPRKASDVTASNGKNGSFTLYNQGASVASVEAYHLIATSEDIAEGARGQNMPITDFKEVGYRTENVPAGFCGPTASYVISFAVTSHERQTHANIPNAWDLYLDYDGDGDPEANIFNSEAAGDLSDGRNLTFGVDLSTGAATAFFFTEHETNSANTVLTVCAEQIGLKAGKVNNSITLAVGGAFDIYFTGTYTDFVGPVIAGGPGVDDSPVTFKGNHTGFQALPPGAGVSGKLSGTSQAALLLMRGGAPEGKESIVVTR